MKRKTVFVTAALGIVFLGQGKVFADVETVSYGSNGQIIFESSTEKTNPVNPTDPDPNKPITPIDPTKTPEEQVGTNGPLSIDFASSFDFGTQKISSSTETYYAALQKYIDSTNVEQSGPNFVQVTDNRGLESGWTLKVKQNGQLKSTSGKELTGAKITMSNGNISTASSSAKPTVENKEITLDASGAESLVMSAQENEGAGTYLYSWGKDADEAKKSVSLEVPGSVTKYAEKYTTTFTWLLTNTPTVK